MTIEHNHRLPFPNGKGYTPCTKEYLLIKNERDAIYDPNEEDRFLKDLDADEYQRWSELDEALAQLQMRGHLGTSVRF